MSSDAMQVRDAAPSYGVEVQAQEVSPGYKRTEIGVIPVDWKATTFEHVFTRINGKPFQIYTDAYRVHGALPVVDQGQSRIVGFTDDEVHRFRCPEGGVIVFGDHTCIVKFVDHDFVVGADGTQIIATKPDHCARFHAFALQLHGIHPTGYNRHFKFLKERIFVCPSFEEQRAIAEALSDVDGLLGASGALIAKKRAIKQAAMQQLLTGKTRLPGFSGAWETKRLGDHVTFLRHGTHSRADLTVDGPVRNLHYGDIHASTGVYLNAREAAMPRLDEYQAGGIDRLDDGDLIMVDASEDLDGVGKSVELTGSAGIDVVSGLHTIAARFDKSVLADGFKAYLQFIPTFRQQLTRLAAGTKVYATNRAHIASVEIPLPRTEEQTAIATVLSDMDAEIAALEARRDKTRAIKQGMMQQLLTGRVRLVEPEGMP